MTQPPSLRRLATTLRRFPWIVSFARALYSLSRPRFTMGVVGVLFNAEGRVLLVEHVFHPYLPWGLPGGWVERNERPGESLLRELREELEIEATLGPLLLIDNLEPDHLDIAYMCSSASPVGKLSYELLGYKWVDPAALPPTHEFHRQAIARAQSLLAIDTRI